MSYSCLKGSFIKTNLKFYKFIKRRLLSKYLSRVSKQEQVHESCSYLWFWNKRKTRTHFYKHKAWHFSQLTKRNKATLNLNILFYTSYYSVMYAKGSQNPITSNIHMWIVLLSLVISEPLTIHSRRLICYTFTLFQEPILVNH